MPLPAPAGIPFESKPSSRAWLVVALLCVVGGLNFLDRAILTTMRQSLVEAIPMTDAQFGLLTSVFVWVYALLSPFAGFLADRFNRSRVIIVSLGVWSLVTWLTAHARTYEELLLSRALMGISEACYIPAALALIADYHRGPTRSLATGLHLVGIHIGQGLGGIGGWLAERHSWSYPFSLFGIIGVVYAGVLLLFLRDTPREGAAVPVAGQPEESVSFFAGLKSLFRLRAFVLALFAWGILGTLGWAVFGWMPTYFQERFGLSQGAAGFSATGYLHIGSLLGSVIGGVIADRWTRTNSRARILLPAIGLCIAAAGIFALSITTVLLVAIVGLFTYGLTRNFMDANLMPILCMIADPRYRATGYGIFNFMACAIGGIGIYVGGRLRDSQIDINTMFLFGVGCILTSALLLFCIKPPVNSQESK